MGTLAAEHSKVRAVLGSSVVDVAMPRSLSFCRRTPPPVSPEPLLLALLFASQVRALARELGFLSLADSLRSGGGGKVAEVAAEVAVKLRL